MPAMSIEQINARTALPAAADIVIGDASRLKDLHRMAEQLNEMGRLML
jgi:hypothetical protein